MERYIVLIANIINDKASVNCFLFEIKNGKQLPVKKGCFEKLPEDSPFRLNSFVMKIVRNGAEWLNDKDQLRPPADDIVGQNQTERSKTDRRNPGESKTDVIQNIHSEDRGAVSPGTNAAVSKETNDRRKNDNSGNRTTITAGDTTATNKNNNHNNNSDNTTISSTINTTNTTNNKSDNSTINGIISDTISTKDSRDNNRGSNSISSTTKTITTTNNNNVDGCSTINSTINSTTTNNRESNTINSNANTTTTNNNYNNVHSSTINSTTSNSTINTTTNKKSETGQVLQNNDKRTKLKGIPQGNGGIAFKIQGNESEKGSTRVSQTPHVVKVSNSSAGSVDEGKHEMKSEEAITEQPQPTDHHITPTIKETRYTHQQSSSNNTNNKSETGQVLQNNNKRNNLEGSPQQNGGLGSESEKAPTPTSEKSNSSAASVGKRRYKMKSEDAITEQPQPTDHHINPTNHEISDSNNDNNNDNNNNNSKKCGCCGIRQVYYLSG